MSLKPWLVDVPVQIYIWVRPECQRRQFEIIKQARPSILFVQSDGGRNEEEWRVINEHRRMYEEEIDWDCTVYRVYADTNCGMYTMALKMHEVIWQHTDRCIFIEDDILPSVSFFRFCAELLEKYKNDERVSCICGTNSFDTRLGCQSDYFFAENGSIWGIAYWKRTVDKFYDFDYARDPHTMHLLKNVSKHDKAIWNQIVDYSTRGLHEGHIPFEEYYLAFAKYGYHQLQIVPTKNLVSNIGFGESSAHADDLRTMTPEVRNMFNTNTYELDFPLKHPKYVINDVEYSQMIERLLCRNRPVRRIMRQVYRFILMTRYKGIKNALLKVRQVFHREREL